MSILAKDTLTMPVLRILDEQGQLLNPHLMPDLPDEKLRELMRRMLFTRVWDERARLLIRQGGLHFYAPMAGQEASMVGSEAATRREDFLLPTYRDGAQAVLHGWPLYQWVLYFRGHQHGGEIPPDVNVLPPQVIIGAQMVQATGVALAFKLRGQARVAITYTGDGGTSEGDFYEGLNFAGVFQVPAVFIVQNNQFAISVPVQAQTAASTLAQKAGAAGIPGVLVDGMDVLAVYAATKQAVDRAREGGGPTLIEMLTYRYGPHTMSGDDPARYRNKELDAAWQQRDPLLRFRAYLTGRKLWSQAEEEATVADAKSTVGAAIEQADAYPGLTVAGLIDSMFEQLPEALRRQSGTYKDG